jgi:uncharacterized protein YegL
MAGLTLTLTPEYPDMAVGREEELLALATVTAPEVDLAAAAAARPALDVVAVVDVSGSMAGGKLQLTQEALRFMITQLTPRDRLALVTFGSLAQTVLPLTAMTPTARATATARVGAFVANTGTNLSGGLFLGLDEVKRRVEPNPVCSVLLLTDGQATDGITDAAELAAAVRAQLGATPPCAVYTFGYGADHNEVLLRQLADAGRGAYYFVDRPDTVPYAFGTCLGGLISTVASRLFLRLDAVNGTTIANMVAAASTLANVQGILPGLGVALPLGDISAGESRDVLLRLRLPALPAPAASVVVLTGMLTYHDLTPGGASVGSAPQGSMGVEREVMAMLTLAWSAAVPDAAARQRHPDVEDQMLRVQAAQALEEARRRAEQGDLLSARAQVTAVQLQVQTAAVRSAVPASSKNAQFRQGMTAQLKDTEALLSSSAVYHGQAAGKVMSSRAQASSNQRGNYDARMSPSMQMYQTPIMAGSSTVFATNVGVTAALPPPPFAMPTTRAPAPSMSANLGGPGQSPVPRLDAAWAPPPPYSSVMAAPNAPQASQIQVPPAPKPASAPAAKDDDAMTE